MTNETMRYRNINVNNQNTLSNCEYDLNKLAHNSTKIVHHDVQDAQYFYQVLNATDSRQCHFSEQQQCCSSEEHPQLSNCSKTSSSSTGGKKTSNMGSKSMNQFVCQTKGCTKSYTTNFALKRHYRSFHQRMKPFSCRLCSKSFAEKVYLIEHMNTHTNSYPYSCKICLQKFKQRSRLSQHIHKSHGKHINFDNTDQASLIIKLDLGEVKNVHQANTIQQLTKTDPIWQDQLKLPLPSLFRNPLEEDETLNDEDRKFHGFLSSIDSTTSVKHSNILTVLEN